MRKIVSPEQARGADRAAMERIGIPGRVLMERAALAVADRVDRRLGPCTVTCVCGPGNNGGDGFAVARLLKERNYEVQVVATGRAENFSGDALANLLSARAMEVPMRPAISGAQVGSTDITVITTAMSLRMSLGKRGRMGRSTIRQASTAFSEGRDSRFKKEPGIRPTE